MDECKPLAGGEPVFLAGSNLHMGTGGGISGFGASPHCLSAADGYAYPAMVVSSALLVCERPAAGAGAGGLLEPHAVGLEAGSGAVGWSAGHQAFGAWPVGLAVTSVRPGAVAAGGGTALTLFGRGRAVQVDSIKNRC